MSNTRKPLSKQDYENIMRQTFNEGDASLTTNGFLVGAIGRKVEIAITTTTIANDTQTVTYSENGNTLYSLKIIYTDGTRTLMLSAERIA